MYKYKQVQQSNSCTIPAIEQEGNQINTDLNVTVTGTNSASLVYIHLFKSECLYNVFTVEKHIL